MSFAFNKKFGGITNKKVGKSNVYLFGRFLNIRIRDLREKNIGKYPNSTKNSSKFFFFALGMREGRPVLTKYEENPMAKYSTRLRVIIS
jgi:hypothetical protein